MVAAHPATSPDRSQDREDVADFRDWLSTKGRSPKTHRTYLQSVESLAGFLTERGMPTLAEARREHVESWLGWLYDSLVESSWRHTYKRMDAREKRRLLAALRRDAS